MKTELFEVQGLCVDVTYLVLGVLQNNTYIISDGQGTMVVDPSCDADKILTALDGATPDAIVVTHGHWDHFGAAAELREATGAPVVASVADAPFIVEPLDKGMARKAVPCAVDRTVANGDVVEVGAMKWKVVETPGHSKGSICLFIIPQFGNHPAGAARGRHAVRRQRGAHRLRGRLHGRDGRLHQEAGGAARRHGGAAGPQQPDHHRGRAAPGVHDVRRRARGVAGRRE